MKDLIKAVVILLLYAGAAPALGSFLARNRIWERWVLALMMFMPGWHPGKLTLMVVSVETYRGHTKGFEYCHLDVLGLAMIVAAAIPLSMLFAFDLMTRAGIAGSLMSLGAIDFGLIVDGAVIVVENAVRRLTEARGRAGRVLTADERIAVIQESTLEVRGAAVFGEIIIAIVYLPILALSGIEGKLFHPMAYTVLFALAGAFVFSLTVVPVLTSYLVRPAAHERETLLLRAVHRVYSPALGLALRLRWLTITGGLVALAGGVALFGRLGAQFVPQLDEGDILVEARRLPGTALSASVDTGLRLERALRQLPEVVSVVTRTGSPELATDPMGVEASDVYIALKDRDEWRPGLNKEQLAEEVAALVETAVPEVAGSISQPIQMRTNELVAGVRSDVGVIVYGPDLAVLEALGAAVMARSSRITFFAAAVTVRVMALGAPVSLALVSFFQAHCFGFAQSKPP